MVNFVNVFDFENLDYSVFDLFQIFVFYKNVFGVYDGLVYCVFCYGSG